MDRKNDKMQTYFLEKGDTESMEESQRLETSEVQSVLAEMRNEMRDYHARKAQPKRGQRCNPKHTLGFSNLINRRDGNAGTQMVMA